MTRRAASWLLLAVLWHVAAPFAVVAGYAAPARDTTIARAAEHASASEWLPRAAAAEELARLPQSDAGQRLPARACIGAERAARGTGLGVARHAPRARWQGHPPRQCPASGWRCADRDDPA